MRISGRPSFDAPAAETTPERVFMSRRTLLRAAGLGATSLVMSGPGRAIAQGTAPTDDLYPAKRNEAFTLDRPLTPEEVNATYNNFYEFGSHKRIYKRAAALPVRPWTVTIDGLVETPQTLDIDSLIRRMPLEERLYRHRCVEAWAMTIPWTGFPMRSLLDLAAPLSSARFVRMETFLDPEVAPGQRQRWYPWPYVEGLTIEEAANDLAFLVTGAYGKPLAKQHGAPLRLATPWKYGFKSIKSIVKFSFTDERPATFWETVNAREYGFWANVNPQVPHPRWSQAEEEMLGTGEKRPTVIFNGYGEHVAGLYKDLSGDELYR